MGCCGTKDEDITRAPAQTRLHLFPTGNQPGQTILRPSFSKRALFPSLCPKKPTARLHSPPPCSHLQSPLTPASTVDLKLRPQSPSLPPPHLTPLWLTSASPTMPSPPSPAPHPPLQLEFSVLPKFVVLWQEVAHLAVMLCLEDLFQQILLAEAISIQNAAPKKELPPSEHLLTEKRNRGQALSTSALNLRTARTALALRTCVGIQASLWWLGKGCCPPQVTG